MGKGYRWINIQDKLYQWKVGKRSVVIMPVDGPKMCPTFEELLGMTSTEVERASWKHYLSVTPADIKDYILKETSDAA